MPEEIASKYTAGSYPLIIAMTLSVMFALFGIISAIPDFGKHLNPEAMIRMEILYFEIAVSMMLFFISLGLFLYITRNDASRFF
jgi:hypothetical protein